MKFKKPTVSEDTHQMQAVSWFRAQYPESLIYSVPNAAKRSYRLATLLKRTGLMAGVPDLVIAEPKGSFHGAYIEMKSEKGKPTESQEQIIKHLATRGYFVAVCHGFDKFVDAVKRYMSL